MKKIIALALVFLMTVLSLAACGTASDTELDSNVNSDSESVADESVVDTDAPEVPEIVMATNAEFPPYEYFENEVIVGIDAEIAQAIADKIGAKLTIEHVDFDSIIPGVQSGKYDFAMAGLTVTDERKELVDFSTSYATGVQVVIVKEDSPITSVEDLFAEGANHLIGVQLATTGDLYSTWDIEDEGLGTVERYNKGADAVMALVSDKVDCVIIDNEPAKVFVENNPGLKILDTEYITEDYAIAVAKENTELMEKIESALTELIADGTVQNIIDKYIPAE